MKLEVKNFPNQVKEFDFYVKNLEDITLIDPVHIKGSAFFSNGKVEISGEYETKVLSSCVRCLKDLEIELKNSFSATFLDRQEYETYLKNLDSECEIDQKEIYDEIQNGVIDLEELVREYIILDMPPYPHCVPKCEDSSQLEKYSDDGIDPRWQQLLEIKN